MENLLNFKNEWNGLARMRTEYFTILKAMYKTMLFLHFISISTHKTTKNWRKITTVIASVAAFPEVINFNQFLFYFFFLFMTLMQCTDTATATKQPIYKIYYLLLVFMRAEYVQFDLPLLQAKYIEQKMCNLYVLKRRRRNETKKKPILSFSKNTIRHFTSG